MGFWDRIRIKVEIKRKCAFLNFLKAPFLKDAIYLTNRFYESKSINESFGRLLEVKQG